MKNNKFKTLFSLTAAAVMFLVSAAAFAIEPVGRIVYLEGVVDLQRDGDILELWDSDIGLEIYNYDLIETGYDGFVEIELTGQRSRGTKVKVDTETAFYFDVARISGDSKTNIMMMSGALSFKVQKLTGNEELNVKTESTVMGVRGTDFKVQRAPEGSVLVTCVEGRVACEDDRKMERYAMPGSIVEKKSGSSLSRVDIDVGDENLYGTYWGGKREEIFRAGAETFVKGYAVQYVNYLPRFIEAFENLSSVGDLLETYGREDSVSAGFSSRMITVKAETTDELIMMRSILPLFEHAFYAVQVLEKYHQSGIGRTRINSGLSSDEFFADFGMKKNDIKNKLADVRHYIKLYVNISRASTPGNMDHPSFFDDVIMGGNPMGSGVPQGGIPQSSLPGN